MSVNDDKAHHCSFCDIKDIIKIAKDAFKNSRDCSHRAVAWHSRAASHGVQPTPHVDHAPFTKFLIGYILCSYTNIDITLTCVRSSMSFIQVTIMKIRIQSYVIATNCSLTVTPTLYPLHPIPSPWQMLLCLFTLCVGKWLKDACSIVGCAINIPVSRRTPFAGTNPFPGTSYTHSSGTSYILLVPQS